jgi:hypothetical protein
MSLRRRETQITIPTAPLYVRSTGGILQLPFAVGLVTVTDKAYRDERAAYMHQLLLNTLKPTAHRIETQPREDEREEDA